MTKLKDDDTADAGLGTPPPAAPDLKLPDPAPAPSGSLTTGEQERQRIEDANKAVKVGQTVVHDTAGNPTVTGAPRPTTAAKADVTLNKHGATYSVATPLGIVVITYEVDDKGVQTVSVGTFTEQDEFRHVSDQVLLKG